MKIRSIHTFILLTIGAVLSIVMWHLLTDIVASSDASWKQADQLRLAAGNLSAQVAILEGMQARQTKEASLMAKDLGQLSKVLSQHQSVTPLGEIDSPLVLRTGQAGMTKAPRQLCQYSEQQIKEILSTPHSCSRGEDRYFLEGYWLDFASLFEKQMSPGRPEVECLLLCLDSTPCSRTPCVVPIHFRPNTSDARVLKQLVEEGDYDVIQPHFRLDSILDAGANIGIAAILFALMYPRARIVSVEASRENFQILVLNVAPFPLVTPVNAALWPRVAKLSLVVGPRTPGLPHWGFVVQESEKVVAEQEVVVETGLLGVTVPFLQKLLGVRVFDFLKIDVEGSEKELFSSKLAGPDWSWVTGAKLAAIETHADIRPGSDRAVKSFFARLEGWSRVVGWNTEYDVYKREASDLGPLGT